VDDGGADIHKANKDGVTAVQTAAYRGHKEIARFLIKRGADVRASSEFGTAADMASEHAKADLAAYLQSKAHCANPDCDGLGAKQCNGCKVTHYCSRECQLVHWKDGGHMLVCAELKQQWKARKKEEKAKAVAANISSSSSSSSSSSFTTASAPRRPAAPTTAVANVCGQCGSTLQGDSTLLCGHCRCVAYCDRTCRTRHWEEGGHKQQCLEEEVMFS
jgi:hypothetical protein